MPQSQYIPIYFNFDTGKTELVENNPNNTITTIRFVQNTPSILWEVLHNKYSNNLIIEVRDLNSNIIDSDKIELISLNLIHISFSIPLTGYADMHFFIGD